MNKLFFVALAGIAMATNVYAEDKAKVPTKAKAKKAEVVKKVAELPENIKLTVVENKYNATTISAVGSKNSIQRINE